MGPIIQHLTFIIQHTHLYTGALFLVKHNSILNVEFLEPIIQHLTFIIQHTHLQC